MPEIPVRRSANLKVPMPPDPTIGGCLQQSIHVSQTPFSKILFSPRLNYCSLSSQAIFFVASNCLRPIKQTIVYNCNLKVKISRLHFKINLKLTLVCLLNVLFILLLVNKIKSNHVCVSFIICYKRQ